MKYLLVILALLLAACGRQENRAADYKVLCDPKLQQAFYITPGAGDTSFVRRNPSLDDLCKQINPAPIDKK